MRLISLELENWGVHTHIKTSLEHSLQIEGRNGTGKSSILEALRFIFARDSRRYKKKIKNGSRGCKVKMTFGESDALYTIEKSLSLKNPSTARMTLNSKVIASNSTEVYNNLQNILPENILEKLLYVPQDGLLSIIESLRIKGGKEELDGLLGLDRFKKVYEGVTEQLKEKRAKLEVLEEHVRQTPKETEDEWQTRIKSIDLELKSIAEKEILEKKKKTDLSDAMQSMKGEIALMKENKLRIEKINLGINQLRLESEKINGEIRSIDKNLEDIKNKKDRLNELRQKKKDLERYEKQRIPLRELGALNQKLRELKDPSILEKEANTLRAALKETDSHSQKNKSLKEKRLQLERESEALNTRLHEKSAYLKELKSLYGKPKCPKCGQNLTKEHMKTEESLMLSETESLTQKKKEFAALINECISRIKESDSLLESLKKKEVSLQHLEKRIAEEKNERQKTLSAIKTKEGELFLIGYTGESQEEVDARLSDLHKTEGEIAMLQKEIEKEPLQREKRTLLKKDLSLKNAAECEFKRTLSDLEFNPGLFDALEGDLKRIEHTVYAIDNTLSDIKKDSEYMKKESQDLRLKLSALKDLKLKHATMRSDMHLIEEAQQVFHTNKGIVKYLRERYIMQLGNQMTHYFRLLNRNPKYRRVSFDKDYQIIIDTTAGEFSADQLSGGERVQLALALRIALIKMISPINLLILDEPFGSLDAEHREVLGESLNKVAFDGQLILVTHIEVESLNLPERIELGGY